VILLWEAFAFVLVLFLGWVYVVKKGVLEWHTER
jgi:NADH:ubiquinone oxidoreductase subunit 3 (subunit A)